MFVVCSIECVNCVMLSIHSEVCSLFVVSSIQCAVWGVYNTYFDLNVLCAECSF